MARGDEVWKPVVGWDGFYEVSSHGRVRSLDRTLLGRAGSTRVLPGKILKPKVQPSGHQSVSLSNGGYIFRSIHGLVLEAFVGLRPEGMFGCHNDGNSGNNRIENLRWDTPRNNSLDAVRHGAQRSLKGPREYEYEYETIVGEEWRPVAGYEGLYEVSSLGRVRIMGRMTRGKGGSRYFRRSHLKKLATDRGGYLNVHLAKDGHKVTPGVHVVVLEAFVGPRPDGMVGCHNDGDPSNNRIDNLRWDTREANARDTVTHGKHPMAGKTHCKHGHEFTPENTILNRNGHRACRACGIAKTHRRRPLSPRAPFWDRTHCPKGHEYTPENTSVHESSVKWSRSCRTCRNERKRQKAAAQRAAIPPRQCEQCGRSMGSKRADARTCGNACRAASRRQRLAAM